MPAAQGSWDSLFREKYITTDNWTVYQTWVAYVYVVSVIHDYRNQAKAWQAQKKQNYKYIYIQQMYSFTLEIITVTVVLI